MAGLRVTPMTDGIAFEFEYQSSEYRLEWVRGSERAILLGSVGSQGWAPRAVRRLGGRPATKFLTDWYTEIVS